MSIKKEVFGHLFFYFDEVTLCENARESCPFFPAKMKRVHMRFEAPPLLAAEAHDEEEALIPYRRVRDAIRAFAETLPEVLMS